MDAEVPHILDVSDLTILKDSVLDQIVGLQDPFYLYLCCIRNFHKLRCCRRYHARAQFMEQQTQRFEEGIDICELFKDHLHMDVLTRVMMTPQQLYLFKHNWRRFATPD